MEQFDKKNNNSFETPTPEKLSDFYYSIPRDSINPEKKEYYPEKVPHIEDMGKVEITRPYENKLINEKDITNRLIAIIENERYLEKVQELQDSDFYRNICN